VQVYATLPDAEAPERLVGFTRVEVAAGGATAFEVRIPVDRLATRDPVGHAWRAPAGRYRITVGRHAADPPAAVADVEL
jgi:beta-glucosidase